MNTLRDYVDWKLAHSDKTAEAEGYPLVLEKCKKNKKMKDLKVYGNSIQDGTPTPENPIEVLSVGNLVTDESDVNFGKYKIPIVQNPNSETIIHNLYLDEPLRKIGNYADYIDFKNQKVVRNVYENVLSGIDRTKYNVNIFSMGSVQAIRFQYRAPYSQYYFPISDGLQVFYYALCNMYPVVSAGKRGDFTVSGSTSNMNSFDIADSNCTTADEWHNYLQEFYNEGRPFKLIHAIRNPIEEDISCQLPKLTEKNTTFTVDSTPTPSNMYGKYIK